MGLSKSRYVKFCQCEKLLWLSVYKPEEATEDPSAQQLIETGHEVGQLAKGLYGKYVETTSYTEDGHCERRKEHLRSGFLVSRQLLCRRYSAQSKRWL